MISVLETPESNNLYVRSVLKHRQSYFRRVFIDSISNSGSFSHYVCRAVAGALDFFFGVSTPFLFSRGWRSGFGKIGRASCRERV